MDSLLEFTEFSADIGEYVYEYSCLEFPSASKDFPVVLTSCGGSMVINGEPVVKTLAGYDSRGRQNSFFIVTPDDPRKVYFQMFYPDETVIQMELSHIAGGNAKWYIHSEKQYSHFL